MALVSEHTHVYRSCIALLNLKGWEITVVFPPYEDEEGFQERYEAQKTEHSSRQIIRLVYSDWHPFTNTTSRINKWIEYAQE